MYGTATEQTAKAPRPRLPLTAARVGALAIGVPVCLVLIASTGYSLVQHIGEASFPVRYAIPAGARSVSVSVAGGDVVLRQVSGDRGTLAGTATYSIFRPRITEHYAGGAASFGYGCRDLFGNCELNATVDVPAGMAVSLNTDGGNVTADGTTGNVDLATGGGDVTADRATGDLTLNTDGGNIRVTGAASAYVAASSGGGDIEIVFTRAPRNVRVRTDGGNITIVVPQGNLHYDVTASTDGGNVSDSVPQNTSSHNKIIATSGGGDVTITQPGT